MTDKVDQLLAEDSERWQATLPRTRSPQDLLGLARTVPRRSRSRSFAVAASVALVAAVAVVAVVTSDNRSPAPTVSAPAGLGTGTSTSTNTAASRGTLSFSYLGPVTQASTLDGGDITVDVPAPGDVAAVSPRTAFRVCTRGTGVCGSSHATMRLALVTTMAAGTAGPSGSIHPLIDNALTYVLEWTNQACPENAGGPQTGIGSRPPPAPTSTSCRLVDFVSATTGEHLYAVEGTP